MSSDGPVNVAGKIKAFYFKFVSNFISNHLLLSSREEQKSGMEPCRTVIIRGEGMEGSVPFSFPCATFLISPSVHIKYITMLSILCLQTEFIIDAKSGRQHDRRNLNSMKKKV